MDARRIHESVLAQSEKRLLIWLAGRTPRWINSDHLTLLGLAAMAGAGLAYWRSRFDNSWLWIVNVCIFLNWLGDSLDGTLARVRDRQRPLYGYYVDHVVDAFSAVFLFGGLGMSGYMHPWIAAGLLLAYLLLSIESYLATYAVKEFRISHFGFGPTELRILLLVGNVFLLYHPHARIMGRQYLLFDAGGFIGMIGMLGTVLFAVVRNTSTLYRRETR